MQLAILLSAVLPIVLTMAGARSIIAGVVLVATWIVFVVDLVVHRRLVPGCLSSGRGRFDLAVVVLTAPWFLLPGLGTSRFVALARLARLFRVIEAVGGAMVRLARQLGRVGAVTGGLILGCAYVALGAERSVNDGFSSYAEAVWWATVAMTTVGYGDIYPVTTVGRLSGAVLMFAGLAVHGVLAGTLASFFGFGGSEEQSGDESAEPLDVSGRDRTEANLGPVAPGMAPTGTASATSAAAEPLDVDEVRRRLDELQQAMDALRARLP